MAGTPLASAYVQVRADTSKVKGDVQDGFNKADTDKMGRDHGDRFSKGLSTGILGGAKGIAGGMAAVFAAAGVANFVGGMVTEARESQKVSAITANAIKVTGGAAKISAEQIDQLAMSLSNKTGVDDEVIQSGANLLLTFKNVRNEVGAGSDIFNQATAAAQDLAAAGFGDSDTAAKMLGKALNDPIRGLAALGKAGVTFTDDQKKQIETLTKTGDILGAQKIIMREVQSQVGGAAAAAADPMQKLGVIVGNLQEKLGFAFLPVIETVATWLGDNLPGAVETLIGWFDQGKAGVEALVNAFRDGADGVSGADGFVGVMELIGVTARKAFDYFQAQVLPRLREFGDFIMGTVVPALQSMAEFVKNNLDFFGPFVAIVLGLVAALRIWAVVQGILNAVMDANPIGLIIIAVAALVAGVIWAYQHFETFRNIVDTAWDVIQNAAKFAWENVIKPIFGYLVGSVQNAWENFNTLKDNISTAWDNIKTFTQNGVRAVINFFLDMAQRILDSAANAFSWIPGIGDKLAEARDKFAVFRDGVNKALGGINDESIKITADMVAREITSGGNAIALGTAVGRMAFGGPVHGPGTGTSDEAGLFRLSNGEHVLTAKQVDAAGGHNAVMAMFAGMAQGGPVGFDVNTALPDPNWIGVEGTAFRDRNADAFAKKTTAALAKQMAATGGGGLGAATNLGGGRVSIQGKLLDATTANIFQKAAAILGGLRLMQGSWSTSVAASGGTHAGAGAMDVAPNSATWDRAVSVIRSLGAIAWHRTPAQGPWGHHIHSITPGVPGLSPAAQRQVASFRAGGNGLGMAGGGPVLFDKGGWLQPGLTMALNKTGRPERVVSPGSEQPIIINVQGSVISEGDLVKKVRDGLTRLGRRGDPLPV